MSKKVFNVFSILCFALVLCFIGCTELINPKTETDINLNIDLSKIIKSTRNTEETQSSVSIGENPTIKVAIYDAKKYNATTNSTDNLDLITEAQAKIVNNEAKVKLNNIPVGIDAIVFAELSFSNENSTEVMYAGNSGVFKVKASDNKISLVLMKVGNSELFPDDTKPEEIINAKEPEIINQPKTFVKYNNESDNEPAKTYLTCTAKSIDGGNLSFKWWYKSEDSTNFEEFNSILEPSLNDDGAYTSSTMQIEVQKNDSVYFYCVVTNTNENATRNKVASVRSNTVQVACIEGTLSSISATYKSDSYELFGKTFNYNNVTVEETYTSGSDDNAKTITFIADERRYTISPNPDSENAIGYVPYTVTYNDSTLTSSPTAPLIVPVKYELDVNNLVLKTYFNSSSVSVSDTENKINIPQHGTVKYSYQDNTVTPSELIKQNNEHTDIKDINSDEQYFKATITSDGTNIANGATCYDVGSYIYTVTLKSANEWFVCNLNTSKDFSVEVYPWEIILTLLDSTSTVDPNNISLDTTYTLSISNKAYIGTNTTFPNATFSCLENNNIITNNELTIDNNFTNGTITASIIINEEEVEVASLEISRVNTSVTYAEDLTCADVQDDGTVTLYISSAKGLATFRDIVNGSSTENISVIYDSNENSDYTFEANTPYPSVNGTLQDSITLSGDWTPIGVYSTTPTSAKPYSGTFDGNGKTVKFEDITHKSSAMYSSGLFQMLAGTVKNLIIDGSISRTDAGYIGGITGYLNGGTIENCVNKALITNSASIGTGGIVGYVGTAGGKITGCINLAKVSFSHSTVGGIVGNVGNMSVNSNLTISKCINLGEISGTSNVSGILGYASASQITISDCMNIGKILANNTSEPAYASGITTPSEDYTVSYCINVGQVSTTSETYASSGAISSIPENGKYTNNYYDSFVNSSVVNDSNTSGISGIATPELIGSNLQLEGITEDNWCFADNRYPLPDIAGSIPGDENGEMWNAVIVAATPESTSTSGGGIDGTIQSLSDLYSYYDSTNDCYSLTTGDYIFGNDLELDKPLYILSGNKVTICSNTNITITSSFSDNKLIYIERGEDNYGTLTLGSGDGVLTLKHENSTCPTIASYGELKLENNCAITGSNYCAINIYNGNFYMNGGEIYGNKYSGSNIQSSAVNLLFTADDSIDTCSAEFYGGKIYNNETNTSGGAIAYTGDATPYIELTGIEIYNNKANSSGGGIYSNTGNLYVNSESKIYDNQVNDTNQGASIFVTEYEGFFYLDYVDTYDIPYTEDIGL